METIAADQQESALSLDLVSGDVERDQTKGGAEGYRMKRMATLVYVSANPPAEPAADGTNHPPLTSSF